MGLEPVGSSQVDLVVDGQQVSTKEVTEDGTIEINTGVNHSSSDLIQNGRSYSETSEYGEQNTARLFQFPVPVTVEINWSTHIVEDYDEDTVGREIRIEAGGSTIHENGGPPLTADYKKESQYGSATVETTYLDVFRDHKQFNYWGPWNYALAYNVSWEVTSVVQEADVRVDDVSFNV